VRSEHGLEPCTSCDKPDCGAIVVITNPSVAREKKSPHRAGDLLDLTCPACGRRFSISISELDWLEVGDDDFARGFFGGRSQRTPEARNTDGARRSGPKRALLGR
jgi:hypothetical protein